MRSDIKANKAHRRIGGKLLLRAVRIYGTAAFLTILAIISSLAAWRMYGRMTLASGGEAAAEHQLAEAQLQKAQVTADLERITTPQGAEGELRQRYGVARPGESVIRFIHATSTDTQPVIGQTADIFAHFWQTIFPW